MAGGTALNYTSAESLLRTSAGKVCGAVLHDRSPLMLGEKEITAKVVINATGPWSDEVREHIGAPAKLRKLRGSHLVFSRSRLNLPSAISLVNPKDRRAMFAIPWEGVSLIGTTDLDHPYSITQCTPFTTQQEIDYILEFAKSTFPTVGLGREDILSSFSGLRPVINTGIPDPSKESRAHAIWEEDGLITVTGGKFTTFRIMAEQTLQKALPHLPFQADLTKRKPYFAKLPNKQPETHLPAEQFAYLLGRYGTEITEFLDCALPGENETILTTPNCWSELRWAARTGGVEHLDDLLLRRVRIGLLLPNGAMSEMARIRAIVQPEMGWSDTRWIQEENDYFNIYQNAYSPSPKGFPKNERTQ
jgi:glycerol-3-phosphate dehydrogenase